MINNIGSKCRHVPSVTARLATGLAEAMPSAAVERAKEEIFIVIRTDYPNLSFRRRYGVIGKRYCAGQHATLYTLE